MSPQTAPRLRFAPSPTGMFHVGGARSALYNWLFVQQQKGTFILRIEDTDEERNKEEWVAGILEAMTWLGLDWDEGPYRQSDNVDRHSAAGATLYADGNAYYCDCTREQVEERTKGNATPGYDNFCRDRKLGLGEGRALRFRVPEGTTVVIDLIRGEPTFENENIEDFVIVRSSGVPMYLLANVVDDMAERITHVVRGEEHLSNTPKQMMLWAALGGGETPIYAHLPVIVNEKRQKLSKRRDKVALEMYRDEGFLPEAMRNYLALLGWAPSGDREIITVEEMIEEFHFEDVNKSGAFFDIQKLSHINGEYIRALDTSEFMERAEPFLTAAPFDVDEGIWKAMAQLVQERVAKLDEIVPMIDFLFIEEPPFEESAMKGIESDAAKAILAAAIDQYASVEWNHEALHAATLAIGEANGLKLGKAQAPIRLAVTGKRVGPPLFESLEVLGRDKTIARMKRLQAVATA